MEKRNDCVFSSMCEEEFDCSNDFCHIGQNMFYLLADAHFPKRYKRPIPLVPESCDVEAFTKLKSISDNAIDFVNKGSSLYLYSANCGNGKTAWASKIMLNYFSQIARDRSAFTDYGVFINVPEYLWALKDQMTLPTKEFPEFSKKLYSAKLVIFDDIAMANSSMYDTNALYSIINHRDSEGLACIYTSNVFPNDLSKHIDERLASRVCHYGENSYLIELKGKDKR